MIRAGRLCHLLEPLSAGWVVGGEHVHQALLLPLQPLDLGLQRLVLRLKGVALLLRDFFRVNLV